MRNDLSNKLSAPHAVFETVDIKIGWMDVARFDAFTEFKNKYMKNKIGIGWVFW